MLLVVAVAAFTVLVAIIEWSQMMASAARPKSVSVLLRHVWAPPPPSAVDLLERKDIKFVVLRERKMNLLGHRGHTSFLLE
jgi:hypothetical protein